MKQLHYENYKGYEIIICGRYIKDYYDLTEKNTSAVKLIFDLFDHHGNLFKIDDFHIWTVAKKNPYKFLFWTVKPKVTFEQQVKNELAELIKYIKLKIDKKLYEEEITDGLIDSLKEL